MKITEQIITVSSETPFKDNGGDAYSHLEEEDNVGSNDYLPGVEIFIYKDHCSLTLYTLHEHYTKVVSKSQIKEMLDLFSHTYAKIVELEENQTI